MPLTDGVQSSMYPRLKDKSGGVETRNSMHIIETLGNQGKLEGSPELKMPPVSTAVAQRRDRKLVKQESLGLNMTNRSGKQSTSGATNCKEASNISES